MKRIAATDWEECCMYFDGKKVPKEIIMPMTLAWYTAISCADLDGLKKMRCMCIIHGEAYVLVIRHIEDKIEWLEKGEN